MRLERGEGVVIPVDVEPGEDRVRVRPTGDRWSQWQPAGAHGRWVTLMAQGAEQSLPGALPKASSARPHHCWRVVLRGGREGIVSRQRGREQGRYDEYQHRHCRHRSDNVRARAYPLPAAPRGLREDVRGLVNGQAHLEQHWPRDRTELLVTVDSKGTAPDSSRVWSHPMPCPPHRSRRPSHRQPR